MKIKDLEENINLLSLISKDYQLKKVGNTYRIIPCPICGSKNGLNIDVAKNYFNCFACKVGGGAYKYLTEVKKMGEDEAKAELNRLAGNGEYKKSVDNEPTKTTEPTPLINYTNIINQIYNNQTETDRQYFINRGLTNEIIDKYKLCVGDVKQLHNKYYGKRAIIPVLKDGKVVYWNSRALEKDPKNKYMKAPGQAVFFNIDHLKTAPGGSLIILTEGEFDALSLESIGIKAIAIGGVENYDNFKEINKREDIIFLTAFDNDQAGQNHNSKNSINIPTQYKDINEWLQGGREPFKTDMISQVKIYHDLIKKPDTVAKYISSSFMEDIDKFKSYKDIKTGFENLDNIMGGFYPGLYVVGGISSVGKTTFVHQLADQLAERGQDIIYFSLEQSRLELLSKSLARITAKNNTPIKSIEIRTGNNDSEVNQSINKYSGIADKISIIEGNFTTDINYIKSYVNKYVALNDVKPVVIIDYLQIIQGDIRLSDKQRIDNNVTELKRLSRDNDIIVIVISSVNRGNYLTPVDFESFKESGGIEYTADVVWGLQLMAIHQAEFSKQNNIAEKRDIIQKAKNEVPRKIELVALKNRNGISNYSCGFNYDPRYDIFTPFNWVDEAEQRPLVKL